MGNGNDYNSLVINAVNQHIREPSCYAAPQPRSNCRTAFRKGGNPFQSKTNFRKKKPPKILLLYLIPGNRIIKLDPGGLKKPNVHGLYFSNTSAAETVLISPAL